MRKALCIFLVLVALVSPVFAGGKKEEPKEDVIVVVPETEKPQVQVTTITTGATVLATVNDVEITKSMVDSYIESLKEEGTDATAQEALNALIAQVVYYQFIEEVSKEYSEEEFQYVVVQAALQIAQQNGLSIEVEQVQDFIEQGLGLSVQDFANAVLPQYIVENYLVENYADFIEQSLREPTEEEVIEAYNDNISIFTTDEMVRVAHIFIPLSDNAYENTAALNTIRNVKERLSSGSYTFEQAVADYSQDSGSNTSGGIINGWLTKGSDEGIVLFGEQGVNVIFGLSIGEISNVVEGPIGYHIFKLIAHRDAGVLGLDDVFYDEVTVREYLTDAIVDVFYDQVLSLALNEKLLPDLLEQAAVVIKGV